jgi:hypothetical protein
MLYTIAVYFLLDVPVNLDFKLEEAISIAIGISSLYSGIYTIILAILMNKHIFRRQGPNLINRIYDGVVVTAVVVIAQVVQYALITWWTYFSASASVYRPSPFILSDEPLILSGAPLTGPPFMLIVFCAFLVGTYLPVTASRDVLRARRILDQCSADRRLLGLV